MLKFVFVIARTVSFHGDSNRRAWCLDYKRFITSRADIASASALIIQHHTGGSITFYSEKVFPANDLYYRIYRTKAGQTANEDVICSFCFLLRKRNRAYTTLKKSTHSNYAV